MVTKSTLLCYICLHVYHIYVAMDSNCTEAKINFSAYKDVNTAFDVLLASCQNGIHLSSREFRGFKNSCVCRVGEPLRSLIKSTDDTSGIFEILADNTDFCNLVDVRVLKVMANSSCNKNLQTLIENYTATIYSTPLREVWSNNNPFYCVVRDKYYKELMGTFGDRDPDDVTVGELMKSRLQLAKKIAIDIMLIK